jgi:hypothetical protein
MTDPAILADLMVRAMACYNRRNVLGLDAIVQYEKIRKLNSYGVLSASALCAIFDVTLYHVEKALKGMPWPKSQGTLNPRHLPWLAYMLSNGKVRDEWLTTMLKEGTSIGTISELTNIPESTLHRRKNGN